MQIIRFGERAYVPAAHEDRTDPGVVKKVLLDREAFIRGGPQMLNWALLPAGKSFRRHYHEDMQEVFVLVEGSVRMEVEAEAAVLRAGDAVVVAPGCAHAMHNIGAGDARYLVLGISRGENGRTIVVGSARPAGEGG